MKCPICGTENQSNAEECVACSHIFKNKAEDISWVDNIDFSKGIEWDLELEKPDISSVLEDDEEGEITIIPTPKPKQNMHRENKQEYTTIEKERQHIVRNSQRENSNVNSNRTKAVQRDVQTAKQNEKNTTNLQSKPNSQSKSSVERKEQGIKSSTKKRVKSQYTNNQQVENKTKNNRVNIEKRYDDEFDEDFAKKVYGGYTKKLLIVVGVAIVVSIIALIVMVMKSMNQGNGSFYRPSVESIQNSNNETVGEETSNETDNSSEIESEPASKEVASSEEVSSESQSEQSLQEGETVTIEGKFQGIVKDGTITITNYLENEAVVTIPSTYDGTPIIAIDKDALKNKTSITTIIIEDGVETIGIDAFYGCSSLTMITLPKSIKEIGEGAFNYCGPLIIICEENTYAYTFAQKWNVPVQLQ